jgi:hypothetical protein
MYTVSLGLALAAISFACTSSPQASVSDANATPAAECGVDCEKACCDEAATCDAAASCDAAAKAECEGEAKVCPVTGAEIN